MSPAPSLFLHVLTNKHVCSPSPKQFPHFPALLLYILPSSLTQPFPLYGGTSVGLYYTETCGPLLLSGPQAREKRGTDEKMRGLLTFKSSSGRSPPLSMPLLMDTNLSKGGLSFTLGLCRLVLSMMIEKESI